MSKSFGKIVIASTILAGACVGAYSYLKKEGLIAANSVSDSDIEQDADAAVSKERNYVDLSSTRLEKPVSEAKEIVSGAKDIVAEAMVSVKEVVSGAVGSIKEVVAEAKEAAEKEEVVDLEESIEEAASTTDSEIEFKEGLDVKEVSSADDHIVGSETTEEEFFDDDEEA